MRCVNGSCIDIRDIEENCYHIVTGSETYSTAVLDCLMIKAGNKTDSKEGGQV